MAISENPFGENDHDPTQLHYQCERCEESFGTADERDKHKRREHFHLTPCRYHVLDDYGMWTHRYEGESTMVAVHQLLAISDGADPSEVFADNTVVHHGPIEHPRANLPGNVQVMDNAEHGRHHNPPINDHVLLGEIYRLDRELDRLPTREDMIEHGEYSLSTYYDHFRSWPHALRLAGVSQP